MALSREATDERRSRIGAFLLSSLRTSAGRCGAAADGFMDEVAANRGIDFDSLDAEDQEFSLADKVVDMCEVTQSSEGYAAAALIVASMSKVNPQRSYRTAWKCLDVWRRKHPAQEAPAMPLTLAMAVVSWLVLSGKPRVAAAVLL